MDKIRQYERSRKKHNPNISLFVPVISASINRYVNHFDIQVLMMVIETETLTSTLHHNIFTYLDIYILYIYIYIYI